MLRNGYSLAIIGTGGSHADLTEGLRGDRIRNEIGSARLGRQGTARIQRRPGYGKHPALRKITGDRAILRALHFYADDARVVEQVEALEHNRFEEFLQLVVESGNSSWMLNQNVFSTKSVAEQGVSLALAVAGSILKGRGAWRVHGGGFAGTIQAFVPDDLSDRFFNEMARIFGKEHCFRVAIRSQGAIQFEL